MSAAGAGFIVTGTDTGVGKTVFAAALAGALEAHYWKPVQAGLDGETDRETVARLSGLPDDRLLPEAYRLASPLSPHRAAEIDGARISRTALRLPDVRPLVVEGAGGLMVPLRRDLLFIDVFAEWSLPVILCARTTLGTINHTLLSIEALRRRDIPLLGVAFLGAANPDSEKTIVTMGETRRLGRLPHLPELDAGALARAFAESFDRQLFVARR
ncbi:MAG: dethiobiotin synthase [Beijerinckiaceae bacterium]|nr:dethiobiotin synthase [Beijerinckiaceae bacterium]